MIDPGPDSKRRSHSPYGRLQCSFACSRSARLQPRRAAPMQPWRSTGQVIVRSNMRPIPASPDASRGICDENRPAPQQRARFSPQVPDYPIPLNDCSLVLPPLSEYGKEANERRRAGSGGNDGNRGGLAEAPAEPREARPQLLGGFAGSSSPKVCKAPAFPQVDDVNSEQHLRKTAQKSGTELPPISWTREMGGFLMRVDLRVKHDVETRRRAVELFDSGKGSWAASRALSVPRETVREWRHIYTARSEARCC